MDGVKAVKRHNAQYDLFNRLHSIAADQAFVREVSEEWYDGRFEVVPNQRCGNWYCPPSATYAYFKSTDGHTNNWNFNLRRANLALAIHAERNGGLVLVDSTRRGKRMPDALSKTIPIWCAVINRAVSSRRRDAQAGQGSRDWDEDLYLPAGVVAPSEREQISALLPQWTEALLSCNATLPMLSRPLRPFFIHPSSSSPPRIPQDADYTPIICLSVSRWVGITGQQDEVPSVTRVGECNVGFEYVPGAGDDDELWAKGLTPAVFWANREKLLALDREELDSGIEAIQLDQDLARRTATLDLQDDPSQGGSHATKMRSRHLTGVPTARSQLAADLGPPVLPVDGWAASSHSGRSLTIWVAEVSKTEAATFPQTISTHPSDPTSAQANHVGIAVPSPKADSWAYKAALNKLLDGTADILDETTHVIMRPASTAHLRLLFSTKMPGDTGITDRLEKVDPPKDLVASRKMLIPVILLLLCSFPHLTAPGSSNDNDTEPIPPAASRTLDKGGISDVMLSIVALWPDGNPPRAALKRVNEILLSGSSSSR